MLYSWCIPYEIWLLSSIEKGKATSIAVQEAPGLLFGETSGDPRTSWEAHSYSSLPPRYFPFKDTLHLYEHIRSKPW